MLRVHPTRRNYEAERSFVSVLPTVEEFPNENILKRVYKGSVGMMMSAVAKKQKLTRKEIDELYAILRQAEEAKE
ncbi:MAG: BlaI/MecI/CopY family transcriptional regulator [Clostridiaceae bacterium]|nr:BlaI/MecI/CopY family transcriptional regulator [Clostridiaceae bacterium]